MSRQITEGLQLRSITKRFGTFVAERRGQSGLIMGRWHPVMAALMAIFFGFVTQMASQLQTLSTPVPSDFLLLLPYVATIIAVAGLIGRTRAPAADGVPYVK